MLCNQFKRHINMLAERKGSDTEHARGGSLDMSRLYRHTYDDNIFQTTVEAREGDSTIIFLIDASGSMNSRINLPPMPGQRSCARTTRFEYCNIIVSAFTKAVGEALGNNLRIEVMSKGSDDIATRGGSGCRGVSLSRTYSSLHQKGSASEGYDGILQVLAKNATGGGNNTPELLVLPGLKRWIGENIMSKNIMVVNLTDGQPQGHAGGINHNITASLPTNAAMYRKYGKWMNMITIYMQEQCEESGRPSDEKMQQMYGDDVLNVDFSEFPHQLITSLSNYITTSI